jgi:hypothetical protein
MQRLTKTDKRVIDSFLNHQSAESRKLSTDGIRLTGNWMGGTNQGRGIAWWSGDKVHTDAPVGRSVQLVQRAVRRAAWPHVLASPTKKRTIGRTARSPNANPLSGPRKDVRDRMIARAVEMARQSTTDYAVWMDAHGKFHSDPATTAPWELTIAVAHAPMGHLSYKQAVRPSRRRLAKARSPRSKELTPAYAKRKARRLASEQMMKERSENRRTAAGDRPLVVGDLVRLRQDALGQHSRTVPAHMGYTREQFDWRDTLRRVGKKTGTVSRVFPNSKHVNVDFADGNRIGIDWTSLVKVSSASPKRRTRKKGFFARIFT